MDNKKLAVLSHDLPPSTSGQSIVLFNLLKTWAPERYCLISNRPQPLNGEKHGSQSSPMLLSASFFQVPPRRQIPIPKPRLLSLSVTLLNLLSETFHRAKHIRKIAAREACTGIVACSGDLVNIPAGFLASRLAKLDYYIYLFDDYKFQWPTKFQRLFAGFMEKTALRRANGVIVPNEFLAQAYQQRYDKKTILIRNPTTAKPLPRKENNFGQGGTVRIGFTGSLYHAHFDAFHNLIEALEGLDGGKFELHIYTPQPPDALQKKGLLGPVVIHPPITLTESLAVQRSFDILFLPLAFQSHIPDVIKTSSPGKLGEYLSSGTPVLVHAPQDSFISWYCNRFRCGYVVDRMEAGTLREAIHALCHDRVLRETLVANAAERASTDFDLEKNSSDFKNIFFGKEE